MKKLILLLTGLLFFGCGQQKQQGTIGDLEAAIQDIVEDTAGDFAVAFKLLDGSGLQVLIHEKEVFHAASTMKTPVMIEIFRQVHAGKMALEDSVLILNEFKSIVDGSPYSMDLGVDSQEELYGRVGQQATVYELMYQMIIKSSNLATNILIEKVGAENVTKTMRDLGAADIQVLRGVEDLKAFDAGLSNTTTALDMMLIMEAIATGEAVGQEESRQMMDILYDQYYKDLIPKLLPDEVKIAHKTGSITGVQHDAAILTLPGGTSYVLVILSKNLSDVAAGKKAINEISKLIYDFVKKEYS
ncbi:beta-lactamase class A [Cyclobacterium lianum]|uniref:beta-lactamase n=1 Tax=Cyclobacterium lianum TaxID=388280 RepID=A0A1M7QG25_9BACT|nr:serine hydrolase [Cyclobacterium lianum]SHN29749.1 beta-lactamase class A [Cyclobacterium lianum]